MKLVSCQNALDTFNSIPYNTTTTMKYDKKFGYYNPKTKKAQVYDGSKRTPTKPLKNGVVGFTIAKIFDGKCSKAQFDKMLTN